LIRAQAGARQRGYRESFSQALLDHVTTTVSGLTLCLQA